MFKKSSPSGQLNMFTSPNALFSGNSLRMYEDAKAWHNQFRKQLTLRIDEDIFRPLYCHNNGTTNAPIRVLVAMMVLKEAEGLSDQKLFENCRFNMLIRSALGLHNVDDVLPTESTYYLFRKRIQEYAIETEINLFDKAFSQITKGQCTEFEVSGKRIRMDSKLLGSNIAWLSRYELIHETLRLFYKEAKLDDRIDKATRERLDEMLQLEGNKVVYICSSEEVKNRLQEFGELIDKLLPLFPPSKYAYSQTLSRVFSEQYTIDENKMVVARDKTEISPKSVQSPHDTDCHYRQKDDQKVKGYSVNVTESCDENSPLNLIAHVGVKKASVSDVDFLQESIKKAQDVLPEKIVDAHADGAYHSTDNQQYCKDNTIELHLHAIQGAKGRYEFNFNENNQLSIVDTTTGEVVDNKEIANKNGVKKWRINTEKAYRYFTQKDIDSYLLRKKIAETPIKTLQFRNNVEATIFQVGYHYPNAKTRYRGEVKHQMWANMRCLWVNFVRVLKYIKQTCLTSSTFAREVLQYLILAFIKTTPKPIFTNMSLMLVLFASSLTCAVNIRFSGS